MYNQNFFTFENISIFIDFINSDNCLKIHPSKSLKDIIFDIFKIDYEEYHQHENLNYNNNNFNLINDNDNEINNDKIKNYDYYNISNENKDKLNENEKEKEYINSKLKIENEKEINENYNNNNNNNDKYSKLSNDDNNINDLSSNRNPEFHQTANFNRGYDLNNYNYYDNYNNDNDNYNYNYTNEKLNTNPKEYFSENEYYKNYEKDEMLSIYNKKNNNYNYTPFKKFQQFENIPHLNNRTNTNFFNKNKINNNNNNTKNKGKLFNENNNNNNNKNQFNIPKINRYLNSKKPMTSIGLKNINQKSDLEFEDRLNADNYPILNEKNYKMQYNNPKLVIDILEPQIMQIKGLSINSQMEKNLRNYEKKLNKIKKPKKQLSKIISIDGQLPPKDLEQIKKKNKLLEYVILQRSKNRFKLENEKRVFELDYSEKTQKNNTKILLNEKN
jgi:hypothetical protein